MEEILLAAHHHVVFLSPNGSTRSVAGALAQGLSGDDSRVSLTALADFDETKGLLESLGGKDGTCLFVGSPVYFNRAVTPVLAFIEDLPSSNGSWAVPFVTYGKACSGIALWQMASALQARGYRIAGALKVQAVHSLMWDSREPVGHGHPDENELGRVRGFAKALNLQVRTGLSTALDLDRLDYHPPALTKELRSLIGHPRPTIPKRVDEKACTECGICAEECPVSTITLSPFPEFGDDCIDCLNCVRLCPEEAISPETSLEEIGEMVKKRVDTVNETPLTEVFTPLPS